MVIINLVLASSAIHAWIRLALVDVQLANRSRKSGSRTVALEASKLIHAQAGVETRLRLAVVDVDFAVATGHSGNAHAGVVGDFVHAGRSFRAGIRGAFVDVDVALLSLEASGADALKVVDLVLARCAILAGHRQTFVDVDVAVLTRVAGRAITLIASWLVVANSGAAESFNLFTLVDVIAVRSLISLLACAGVVVQCPRFRMASGVVWTWIGDTSAVSIKALSCGHFKLTKLPIKPSRAETIVAAVRQARPPVRALTFILIRQRQRGLTSTP